MLYPKRTKFRKYFKGPTKGIKPDSVKLSFGQFGILACESGRISSQTIEAARRVMSRKFKRNGRIWVRAFADTPITKKPTEVRMGKGKGNPAGWAAKVSAGQLLFEIDGVTVANAMQAAKLASHKLNVLSKCIQWS